MSMSRVATWVLSGHVGSAAVLSLLAVLHGLGASTTDLAPGKIAQHLAGGWLLVLAALLLACLENIPKLVALVFLYSRAADRWPALESTWLGTIAVGLLAAAGSAGLAHYVGFGAWVFSRIYDVQANDVPVEALAALSVGLAFILPRVFLRSLRPDRKTITAKGTPDQPGINLPPP
jgi:hypothetical protein